MTAVIVSGATPFGAMSNSMVENFYQLDQQITRLASAAADAASGYTGTAGTEYEGNSTNFGVVAGSAPGANGAAWAYAINVLATNWAAFKTANLASIQQLDNG